MSAAATEKPKPASAKTFRYAAVFHNPEGLEVVIVCKKLKDLQHFWELITFSRPPLNPKLIEEVALTPREQ